MTNLVFAYVTVVFTKGCTMIKNRVQNCSAVPTHRFNDRGYRTNW